MTKFQVSTLTGRIQDFKEDTGNTTTCNGAIEPREVVRVNLNVVSLMEWIPSNYSYESNVEIFGETDTCLERPVEGDCYRNTCR